MKLSLIGAGNLGKQLYRVLQHAPKVELIQWMDRSSNETSTPEGIQLIHHLSAIAEVDCYLLAVSDDSIESLSELLPKQALVIHTAGGRPLAQIKKQERKGVFYPIQSFSSSRIIDFSKISIGIEASKSSDQAFLFNLAHELKANPIYLDSRKRLALHLAAVFTNNFTNHLLLHAEEICRSYDLSFDLLKPLLRETIDKLEELAPKKAQTGPAIRNDITTLNSHRKLLENKDLLSLYNQITNSIQKNSKNEL